MNWSTVSCKVLAYISFSTEVLSLDVNNAPDFDTSEFTAEQYLDRRRKSTPAKR